MILCGVDEAGKGAVLGPLVVAAVACERQQDLAELGVKDSKALAPARREALSAEIRASCPVEVLVISPGEIDSRGMTMNALMARSHARVIAALHPALAVVDACDVVAARYGAMVSSHLDIPCRVISRHHADRHHPAVSAASIVAKVERDRAIEALREEYGEIGSGYPSDSCTVRFLEEYVGMHHGPPPIARRSWETVRALVARHEQASLLEFPGGDPK
jgi:ribonuclease HII